ncbi:MAG: DNA polymerase III subunit beta [Patescibacteria group bacterium]
MKIELLQSNLSSAVKKAARFLSTKPQLPILSCFFLEAVDQNIWLTATDLQMGMRQQIQGTVTEPGACVIPAKVLNELVSSLSGSVELSLNDLALTIKTKQIKSVINTFPVQDFPPFPQTEGTAMTLPIEFFNQTVDFVTFASSRDESRPILTSVLFELAKNAKVVSTDGYRLAVLQAELDVAEPQTLLFPAKALDEITKVIQSESVKSVQLSLSEGAKQVFFSLPNSQIVLRTLEGEFPNYQKIIPASFATEVRLDAQEFEHHVKSAMIFSNEGSSIVLIEISPDQVVVSAKSSLLGEYESSLKAKSNTEEVMTIAFNGRYILDFLQRISGKECILRCNDPLKSAQLSCTEVPGFFYIVMPFRLNS